MRSFSVRRRVRGGKLLAMTAASVAVVGAFVTSVPVARAAKLASNEVPPGALATVSVPARPRGGFNEARTRELFDVVASLVRSRGADGSAVRDVFGLLRLMVEDETPVRSMSLTSLRASDDGARHAWSLVLLTQGGVPSDAFAQLDLSARDGLARSVRSSAPGGELIDINCATDAAANALRSPAWGEIPSVWPAHDAALARAKPAITGRTALDVRVDLSALRRAAPGLFFAPPSLDPAGEGAGSRAHGVLRALGLGSARAVGIRATRVPAAEVRIADLRGVSDAARGAVYPGPDLVRVDLTHSSRASGLNEAGLVPIALGYWPRELTTLPPTDAPWAMVIRCDQGGPGMSEFGSGVVGWSRWLSGVWLAMTPAGERGEVLRALSAWQPRGGGAIRTVSQTMGRWAVAWPLAKDGLGDVRPGEIQLAAACPLRTPANMANASEAMTKLGASVDAEAIAPGDGLLAGWSVRWSVTGTTPETKVVWTAAAGVFARDETHAEMYVATLQIGANEAPGAVLRRARNGTRPMPAAKQGDHDAGAPAPGGGRR